MRLLCTIILLLATPLYANQLVREMMSEAQSISNYKEQPAQVSLFHVDKITLQYILCGRPCTPAPIAVTIPNNIYLADRHVDLNTPYGESILFHESVHLLQFHNKGSADTCQEWINREIEAYSLQVIYNLKRKYSTEEPVYMIQKMREYKCGGRQAPTSKENQ